MDLSQPNSTIHVPLDVFFFQNQAEEENLYVKW